MKSKKRKQIQQQISDDDQDQADKGKRNKTMSQYRDYMSMRAHHVNIAKQKKKTHKTVQNHSLVVHKHLQPDVQEVVQDSDDNDGNDPTSLIANYSTDAYKKWIAIKKKSILNQKPYTEQNQMLLDALAMRNTNICIYGYGSKIQYVRQLVRNHLSDHNVWEVNGYKMGLNQKKIYNNFGNFLKQVKISKEFAKINIKQQQKQYKECLQQYQQKQDSKQLVVVFHCIDSLNFINSDAQFHLSRLFSLPKIKLICTVQSIKIASVWHPKVKQQYNFQFFHINTAVPYLTEQIWRPNTAQAREMKQQAIIHIFQSLNNNQKRILKLFAKKQLDNLNREQPEYFTLQSLLQQCIQNVILSNDMQLRQNLYELLDHKVIVNKECTQSDRVKKYYTIECNKAMLDRIYSQKIQD